MRYTIDHELPQRIRLTLSDRIPVSDAAALESMLASWAGVERVRVYPRIRSVAIWSRDEVAKTALLGRLDALTPGQLGAAGAQLSGALAPADTPVVRNIARLAGSYLMRRWFMPPTERVGRETPPGLSETCFAESWRRLAQPANQGDQCVCTQIRAGLTMGRLAA